MEDFITKHPLFEELRLWKLDVGQIDPRESKYLDHFHPGSRFTIDSVGLCAQRKWSRE